MPLRSDLAALDATPAAGWTAEQRAEHAAWLATMPTEEQAVDPDAFTISSYFECKAVDAMLRRAALSGDEAERVRRWLAAEDDADAGEIPF